MEKDFEFFYRRLMQLLKIQESVDGENCFEKLVEYFKVCQEISKREESLLRLGDETIQEMIFMFLNTLPFCLSESTQNVYISPSERDNDEVFLGCTSENQVYERYFECLCENSFVGILFTFNDEPSMDTITLFLGNTHRTLSYIDGVEEDEDVVDLMLLYIYCFFQDNLVELKNFIGSCALYISSEFFGFGRNHTMS
jgi:hypothetical protein